MRKAHGIISMLRRIFAYGVTAELSECTRLATILDNARFKQPGRRRVASLGCSTRRVLCREGDPDWIRLSPGFGHRPSVRDNAAPTRRHRRMGAYSGWNRQIRHRARGKALGERSHLVRHLRRHDGGERDDQDRRACCARSQALPDCLHSPPRQRSPASARLGPLIIDEKAGRPYAEHAYSREWREVAREAGVPDRVWNMDARAGGISEADDAGADLDSIRSAAGHTQASTTARYVRGTIGKSRKVAELRLAHREKARKHGVND